MHGEKSSIKKRKFDKLEDYGESDIPAKYRHIRVTSRSVKKEFYQTVAALARTGMSISDAASSVVAVGNGVFGTHWTRHEESDVLDGGHIAIK